MADDDYDPADDTNAITPDEVIDERDEGAAVAAAPAVPGNTNQPYADPRVGAADIGPGPQPYPPGQEPRPGHSGGLGRAKDPIPVPDDPDA